MLKRVFKLNETGAPLRKELLEQLDQEGQIPSPGRLSRDRKFDVRSEVASTAGFWSDGEGGFSESDSDDVGIDEDPEVRRKARENRRLRKQFQHDMRVNIRKDREAARARMKEALKKTTRE